MTMETRTEGEHLSQIVYETSTKTGSSEAVLPTGGALTLFTQSGCKEKTGNPLPALVSDMKVQPQRNKQELLPSPTTQKSKEKASPVVAVSNTHRQQSYHLPPHGHFPMHPFGYSMYPPFSSVPPSSYPFQEAQSDPCKPSSSDSNDRTSSSGNNNMMTPFPVKLYDMLETCETEGKESVASFFPHGRAFAIHDPQRFVSEVMPRFFRQTKLTSFQRQLNLYGFRRISQGQDAGGYYHELFLRGRPGLTTKMKRVKVKGAQRMSRGGIETDPNFYSYPPVHSERSMRDGRPSYGATPYDCVMPPYYFYMYGGMGPYQAAQASSQYEAPPTAASTVNKKSTPESVAATEIPSSIPTYSQSLLNYGANYPRTLPKHSPVVPLSQQKPFTPLKWFEDGWADFNIPDTPLVGDPVQLLGVMDASPSHTASPGDRTRSHHAVLEN